MTVLPAPAETRQFTAPTAETASYVLPPVVTVIVTIAGSSPERL